jgi:hypothetical protein
LPRFEINFNAEKHLYTDSMGELLSVTDVIGGAGFFQKSQYKWGSAERGHDLHSLFQFADEGTLDWGTVDEKYLPYLTQYDKAMKQIGVKWTDHERIVGHQPLRYSGTIDKISSESWSMGEVKTGKKEKWHRLQCCAYMGAFEWYNDHPLKECYLIYVHAEDFEVIKLGDLKEEWQTFLSCLDVVKYRRGK